MDVQKAKLVWKTTIIDLAGNEDGNENLVEVQNGFVVFGEGASSDSGAQIVLLNKDNGATKWKTWLTTTTIKEKFAADMEADGAIKDHKISHVKIQSVAENERGIWMLGTLHGSKTKEGESAANMVSSFLLRLSPENGAIDMDSLRLHQNRTKDIQLYDFVLTQDAIFAVGGTVKNTVDPSNNRQSNTVIGLPYIGKFDYEFEIIKEDSLRVDKGVFKKMVYEKLTNTVYVAGKVGQRLIVSNYDDQLMNKWTHTENAAAPILERKKLHGYADVPTGIETLFGETQRAKGNGNDTFVYEDQDLKLNPLGGVFYTNELVPAKIGQLNLQGEPSPGLVVESSIFLSESQKENLRQQLGFIACDQGKAAVDTFFPQIRAFAVSATGEFFIGGNIVGRRVCVRGNEIPPDGQKQQANWLAFSIPTPPLTQAPAKIEVTTAVKSKHPFEGGGLAYIQSGDKFSNHDQKWYQYRVTREGKTYYKDSQSGALYIQDGQRLQPLK